MKKEKNDKDKIIANCLASGCTLKIYASVIPDRRTFMVKTLNKKHTCVWPSRNNTTTALWITKKMLPYLSADLNLSDDVIVIMLEEYRLHPNDM